MCKIAKLPIARYGVLCIAVIMFLLRMHRLWSLGANMSDDLAMIYLGAKMLLHHQSPYNEYQAFLMSHRYLPVAQQWDRPYPIAYPPSTVLLVAPLTIVSYTVARSLWFFLSFGAYPLGIFVLIRAAFPRLSWEYALSISLAAVLTAYFGFCVLCVQFAAVLAALIFVFVACELSGQSRLAWLCATLVICIKLTFALPFVGLYLLQRRYKALAAAFAVFAVFNLAGFLMRGHLSDINGLLQSTNALLHEQINSVNPRTAHGLERTDITYLIMGLLNNEKAAVAVGYLFDVLAFASIMILGMRAIKLKDHKIAVCAVCGPLIVLSLLSVYHQRYDLTLLVAPAVLCAYLLAHNFARRTAISLLLVVAAESVYFSERFKHVVAGLHFLPDFFPKIIISALLVVLFVLSVMMLREAADSRDAERIRTSVESS